MVQGAIGGIRKLCAVVKEAQAAGKEVADLTSQVTGYVSTILEGNDKLQKAEQELRTNPPKDKSLQVLAFEETSRKYELKKQYEELRNMIIYELGLPGGFWSDFEQTLQRMEEQDKIAKQQVELQRKQAQWQREKLLNEIETNLLVVVAVILAAMYMGALMWAIRLHKENQLSLPWG